MIGTHRSTRHCIEGPQYSEGREPLLDVKDPVPFLTALAFSPRKLCRRRLIQGRKDNGDREGAEWGQERSWDW